MTDSPDVGDGWAARARAAEQYAQRLLDERDEARRAALRHEQAHADVARLLQAVHSRAPHAVTAAAAALELDGPPTSPPLAVPYDRAVLAEVVIYHYKDRIEGCRCGWSRLGAGHGQHVADVYEASVAARGHAT